MSARSKQPREWRRPAFWNLEINPQITLLIIAGFFLLATLARILRSEALESDEMQQMLHSRSFQLGYGSQPPAYDWLQYGVIQLLGPSIFSLSILKNGLLFLGTVFMAACLNAVTNSRTLSALAALSMFSMPTVFLMSQRDLTHTVAAIVCVPLFFWALFRALNRPTLANYVFVGVIVGFGAISKYNFVLIPASAMVVLAFTKEFRPRLMDWRILATAAAAIAVVLPHTLWLVNNLDLASAQTLSEMELEKYISRVSVFVSGSTSFTTAALKAALPILSFFVLLFPHEIKTIATARDRWTQFVGWTFVVSIVLVFATVMLIGATEIRQKWLSVYMVTLPIYFTLKIRASGVKVDERLRKAVIVASVLCLGAVSILLGSSLLGPALGRHSKTHIPYPALAEILKQQGGDNPDLIITGDGALAANMRLHFPNASILRFDRKEAGQIPEGAKTIFVSTTATVGGSFASQLGEFLPRAVVPPSLEFQQVTVPYPSSKTKTYTFYYAIFPVSFIQISKY